MNIDPIEFASKIGSFFIPFVFALCFHECAHAWMALKKGDRTALIMGRLSMNPFVHMDLVGTVLLPLMALLSPGLPLFGWAKPVPVNMRNLKNIKKDLFWIALAGPLSNVFLAVVGMGVFLSLCAFSFTGGIVLAFKQMLGSFILTNFYLAFFNMIPLHPLDGGKILARFLSPRWNDLLEENTFILNMILILLVVFGGISYLARPIILFFTWFLGVSGC